MRAILLVLSVLAGLGCGSRPGAYVCSTDPDCAVAGGTGYCEADGRCSVADATCPGGRRYGDSAGALAGTCVGDEVDAASGDAPPDGLAPDASPDAVAVDPRLCAPAPAADASEPCAAIVCAQRPGCCTTGWDEGCVRAAEVHCGRHCSQLLATAIHARAMVGAFDGTTFSPRELFGNPFWVYDLRWGHANGDARADLAAARQPQGAASGLLIRTTTGLTGGQLTVDEVPLTGDLVGQVDRIEWADVDGDGDLDVVVAGITGLFIARNEGASFAVTRLTSETVAGVVTVDVDGVPPLELLVAFNPTPALGDERTVLHRLTSTTDFTLDGGTVLGAEFPHNPTRCQLQPGRPHVASSYGVYAPTAGGLTARSGPGFGAFACGDLDGDGWDDAVVAGYDAPIRVFLSRGGFETTAAWTSAVSYEGFEVELGDVDGDGKLDVVVNEASAPDRPFTFLHNTSSGGTINFEERVISDWDPANTNHRFDLGPAPP